MARKPRLQLPGIPQHVIQRGNNRESCFFAESDYRRHGTLWEGRYKSSLIAREDIRRHGHPRKVK